MKVPERQGGVAGLSLEQLHVEQKRLARHVFVIEQLDEGFFVAKLLDVQRDRRVAIGSKQREEVLRRRFVGRRHSIVRDVEATVSGASNVGLDTPPAIERRLYRWQAVFRGGIRADEISAVRKNDRHSSPVRRAASHLPPS